MDVLTNFLPKFALMSAAATGVIVAAQSSSPVRSETSASPHTCEALRTLANRDFRVLEVRDIAAGVAPAFYGENDGQRMPAHCLMRGGFGERTGVWSDL